MRLWTVVFLMLRYHPGTISSLGWSMGCSLLRRYRLNALLIGIESEMKRVPVFLGGGGGGSCRVT